MSKFRQLITENVPKVTDWSQKNRRQSKSAGGEIAERVLRPGAQAPQRVTCTRPPHVDCHVRCPCSRPTPVPEGQRAGATAQLPERFGDATSGQVRLGPSAPVVLVASA